MMCLSVKLYLGVKMEKMKEILKTTKGKVIGGISLLAVLTVAIVLIISYPPSVDKLYEKYSSMSEIDNKVAIQYLREELDGKGIFGKLETKRFKAVLQKAMDEINNDFIAATGGTVEDYQSVKITDVAIKNRGSYSNYSDVLITVKNNSEKDIRYIQVNIYYKDYNGTIIKSDWTNDNSIIKPGASQTLECMSKRDGWKNVECEIESIKFN